MPHPSAESLLFPVVATLAGSGRRGCVDGHRTREAYLDGCTDIAQLSSTRFLLVDGRNSLRTLDVAGDMCVRTLRTLPFLLPRSPCVMAAGDGAPTGVVVADSGHNKVRLLQFLAGGEVRDAPLAGSGHKGASDGPAEAATFCNPSGIAVLPDGSIIVADTGNHAIRRIAGRQGKAGLFVTTLAGGPAVGGAGFLDGDGGALHSPTGLCVDPLTSTIFVADSGNHAIRALHPPLSGPGAQWGWLLTTLCGDGAPGFADAPRSAARGGRLREPCALALSREGSLLISDSGNNAVRALMPGGDAADGGLFSRSPLHGSNALVHATIPPAGGSARSSGASEGSALTSAPPLLLHLRSVVRGSDGSLMPKRLLIVSPAMLLLHTNGGSGGDGGGPPPQLATTQHNTQRCGGTRNSGASPTRVALGAFTASPAYSALVDAVDAAVALEEVRSGGGGGGGEGAVHPLPLAIATHARPSAIAALHARFSKLVTVAGTTPAAIDAAVDAALQRGGGEQPGALSKQPRFADGLSTEEARFRRPHGLCSAQGDVFGGSILVCDAGNSLVRIMASSEAIAYAAAGSAAGGQGEALSGLVSDELLARGLEALSSSAAAAAVSGVGSSSGRDSIEEGWKLPHLQGGGGAHSPLEALANFPLSFEHDNGPLSSTGSSPSSLSRWSGRSPLSQQQPQQQGIIPNHMRPTDSSTRAAVGPFAVARGSPPSAAFRAAFEGAFAPAHVAARTEATVLMSLLQSEQDRPPSTDGFGRGPGSVSHTGGQDASQVLGKVALHKARASRGVPAPPVGGATDGSDAAYAAGLLMAAALAAPAHPSDTALLADDPKALLWASSHVVAQLAQETPVARAQQARLQRVAAHVGVFVGDHESIARRSAAISSPPLPIAHAVSAPRGGSSGAGGWGEDEARIASLRSSHHTLPHARDWVKTPEAIFRHSLRPGSSVIAGGAAATAKGPTSAAAAMGSSFTGYASSRDAVAAESRDAVGALLRSLLSGGHAASSQRPLSALSATAAATVESAARNGSHQPPTTASPALVAASFTRHTAASVAHQRASGRLVVRGAPAFVNASKAIKHSLEDLTRRLPSPPPQHHVLPPPLFAASAAAPRTAPAPPPAPPHRALSPAASLAAALASSATAIAMRLTAERRGSIVGGSSRDAMRRDSLGGGGVGNGSSAPGSRRDSLSGLVAPSSIDSVDDRGAASATQQSRITRAVATAVGGAPFGGDAPMATLDGGRLSLDTLGAGGALSPLEALAAASLTDEDDEVHVTQGRGGTALPLGADPSFASVRLHHPVLGRRKK